MGERPITTPLPTQDNTEERGHTFTLQMGFEPTFRFLEVQEIRALDRTALFKLLYRTMLYLVYRCGLFPWG